MHALLDRLKRERRWALLLFLAAIAVIVLVQRFVVPQTAASEHRPSASENSG